MSKKNTLPFIHHIVFSQKSLGYQQFFFLFFFIINIYIIYIYFSFFFFFFLLLIYILYIYIFFFFLSFFFIINIYIIYIYFSFFLLFFLTLFFITNITVENRKTNYSDLRTVSLNKTNCSYLINRTHLIVLSVVLRQQRGYLFLHTFSSFHSWDLQLSSVCVIHSNGIIGTMQLD